MNVTTQNVDTRIANTRNNTFRGWIRLSITLVVIAITWLGILPWLGRLPLVEEHIARQQRLGIDPSAMFYTELEIMPEIAHRRERLGIGSAPGER